IPERQQPLRVRRIVYYEDAVFQAIYEAQVGPLPYAVRQDPELALLRAEAAALRQTVIAGGKGVVAYRSEARGGMRADVVNTSIDRSAVSEDEGQMEKAGEVIARMRAFDEALTASEWVSEVAAN